MNQVSEYWPKRHCADRGHSAGNTKNFFNRISLYSLAIAHPLFGRRIFLVHNPKDKLRENNAELIINISMAFSNLPSGVLSFFLKARE